MFVKRCADILLSTMILTLSLPAMAVIALAVWLESGSPVFFRQERVGREFRRFHMFKFRTMQVANHGPLVTVLGDCRVTKVGRILRFSKADELPQFWNVLRGDMSVVGPRPEVPQYVELFRDRYERILTVRPGITDLASIYYRNEELILAKSESPLNEYKKRILPAKLDLADKYVSERNALVDISIVLRTVAVMFVPTLCRQNR